MGITNWISSILTPKQIVVTFNGKTFIVLRDSPGFTDIKKAADAKDILALENKLTQYGFIRQAVQEVKKEFDRIQKELEDIAGTGSDTPVAEDDDDDSYEEGDEDGDESDFPNDHTDHDEAPVEPAVKDRSNVKKSSHVDLEIGEDGILTINGVKFNNKLSKKIAQLYFDGYPIEAYYKLIKKIAHNPERAVQSGLLDFIASNDLPITTDGRFLAYKVTRADGFDCHSGTINYLEHFKNNKPITMKRSEVDKSRGVCSGRGLYFASIGYYSDNGHYSGGGKRFLLVIDPSDVVSIPTTYENSKGRACKMTVVKEIQFGDGDDIPKSTSIIDLATWKNVQPTDRNKNAEKIIGKVVQTGTQKLIKLTPEVRIKIDNYIKRSFERNNQPSISNIQKAIKVNGVSVTQIAEAVEQIGYTIEHEGKITGVSLVAKPKSSKKFTK